MCTTVRLLIGLAVAGLILYILLQDTDLRAVGQLLIGLDVGYAVGAVVLLYVAIVFLESWRLFLAIRSDLTFTAAQRMVTVGLLATNVVGSSAAGDAWRIHKLRSLPGSLGSKFSRLVAVRILGIVAMLVSFAVWLPFVWSFVATLIPRADTFDFARIVLVAALATAALAVGATALFVFPRLSSQVHRLVSRFLDALVDLPRSTWMIIAGLSLGINVVRAMSISFFIYALGGDIPLLFPVGLVALVVLSNIVPLTPANIGVTEFIYVAALTFLQQSPELSLAVAILNRISLIAISLFGLPALLSDPTFRWRGER